MTVNVTYREAGAVVPGATTIKNSPLSNGEIDGNFKSVKDAVEVLSTASGAGLIGVTPVGGVVATTVQAAIAELDTEKVNTANLAASSGSSLVGYMPAGAGSVTTTVQNKLRESVSVADFDGYDKTGVSSSVAAINSALASSGHVIVPVGHTPLIDATITIPAGKCLEFKGSYGNPVTLPGSYFIKASTLNGPGIRLDQAATMIGGGVVCQEGNGGDGILLARNAARALYPFAKGAGGVGIRVGTDAGDNTNNTELHKPVSVYNGSHGIYVHDGFGDDANAGVIYAPKCVHNGGDGVHLGHCYWVTVHAGNCEVNTGWGLYLSGNDRNSYPECRWPNIVGGDYNEGNTAGVVFDASYYALITNADGLNLPTTAPNGLQGSARRTFIGHLNSVFPSIKTYAAVSEFQQPGSRFPVEIKRVGNNATADGVGVKFLLDRTNSGTFVNAAEIRSWQGSSSLDGIIFSANKDGAMETQVIMSPYYGGMAPGADNARILGHPAFRWSTVYAATGTINTSDEREKQQIRSLTDDERAVAVRVKSLIRAFKFNDSVKNKGDAARIHFGVIAQDVKAAFEAEGLAAQDYAILCYDEWIEQVEVRDDDGSVMQEYRPAGNRYGVRYEELLAFIIAAL